MKPVVFIIGLLLVASCMQDKNAQPIVKPYSYYHWNTFLENTPQLQERLKMAGSDTLYIRFFDLAVDKQQDAVLPIATLQIDTVLTLPVNHIVPVIYIKNEVFLHKDGSAAQAAVLASNLASKIKRLFQSHFKNSIVKQVQIDCDWTDSTQEAYFTFLKTLKQQVDFVSINANQPTQLTATIRLHQVKYRERTGVPPIDRGVIMVYNVGDLGDVNEQNSIINNATTATYLGRLKEYPLGYDIALPVFSWYVVYRNNKLTAIINEIDAITLSQNTTRATVNKIKVHTPFNTGTTYLYKDDIIRKESVTAAQLKELATLVKKEAAQDYNTILYHINASVLNNLPTYEIEQSIK